MLHNPPQADRSRERARNWISIPDANLPEPWTCNWAHWPYWAGVRPLEAALPARYALSNAPLTPVMFNSSNRAATTVFACATTGKYYLYYRRWALPKLTEEVHAFEGAFSSVEAFIEQADWNRMKRMNPARWDDKATVASTIAPPLLLINNRGFRVAAHEPYPRRTLWDMCPPPGTFGYVQREIDYIGLHEIPRVSEWPCIPDSELPVPWSCEWHAFVDSLDWYDEPQSNMVETYGHALAGFVPALCEHMDCHRGDTVLCPPGGAGTYYLWKTETREWTPTSPSAMQRFHGVFASLEHFVRTADWNRLEGVVPLH
ncbi:hypothetical protein C8J57DRAFT_1312763 [Mycena rebaudengoi]|nr:hypothetical protein C8J57DRAFT_1312763 [Mycena rebaudengoi]